MKKIVSLLLTVFMSLSLNTCAFAEKLPAPDYNAMMIDAAVSGDTAAGHEAEAMREACPSASSAGPAVSFDDLYLLSKFICAQAGSRHQSDEFLLCSGEVILNRTASPEFPDSIYEVIYDEWQYPFADSEEFETLVPDRHCTELALRLLQGERHMENYVVFQSDIKLGNVYSSFGNRILGFTYFCESPNLQLYSTDSSDSLRTELHTNLSDAPNVSVSADSFRDYKDNSIIVVSEKPPSDN